MMVSEEFKIGDLVWAKMKGYPQWPARIEPSPSDIKASKNKKSYVYFFGSENFAWISNEKITPHSEGLIGKNSKKKFGAYQNAIEAFINYTKSHRKEKVISHTNKKARDVNGSVKSKKKVVQKLLNSSAENKKTHQSFLKKSDRKRLYEMDSTVGTGGCSYPKSMKLETNEFPRVGSVPPSMIHSEMDDMLARNGNRSPFEQNALGNIGRSSYLLEEKHVTPSSKKFGFIGLGHIGSRIVETLIETNHDVTIWNKTSYKCDSFIAKGAKRAPSVADLIMQCDITFSCVSDPEASKSLIFGDQGILRGLELSGKRGKKNKGYVEMTSIDATTSQEIAETIALKQGRYLEAPVCGTSKDAEEGTLLVLAAGDRKLFLDCETCFHAISKHTYYMSCVVGNGSNMGLILSTVSGTVSAAVAEAMVLVEKLNLPHDDFYEILRIGPLQCHRIVEKAKRIAGQYHKKSITPGQNHEKSITPGQNHEKSITPLKHVQKDLNLSLMMSNSYSQPMPVTAAANEVYKHARMLKCSDYDVSAVYKAVRF